MLTLISFLVALGILIAVHEWGHFQTARLCGVEVKRFSIGFGPTVLAWTSEKSGTEYTLSLLPLGGYVRMLDSREEEVPAEKLQYAFDHKKLSQRAAIVAAGPLANLTLAVILYSIVNWSGLMEPVARVSRPLEGSIAAQAGFVGGEVISKAGFAGEELSDIQSFENLRWWLVKGALSDKDIQVAVAGGGSEERIFSLALASLEASEADASLFRAIGFTGPYSPAVLGDIVPGAAADRAGLRPGDIVQKAGNTVIRDAAHLREWVRESGKLDKPVASKWEIIRAGTKTEIEVTPVQESQDGLRVGRIGAVVGNAPEMVLVHYGFLEGLFKAVTRTWEISALTVRMFGQMLVGNASLKNISGPITIADYAGKSAGMGLSEYMIFLALISVSLGVINLFPIPVLDGGHLMYYLWEAVTGKPVPSGWMDIFQKTGMAFLFLLMSVAIFNDISRLSA